MESSNAIYKEMQILQSENIVLQNNCLFVYDLLQINLATAFENCFHKTDHHSQNTRNEKFNVLITKTSTHGLQSVTSNSTWG